MDYSLISLIATPLYLHKEQEKGRIYQVTVRFFAPMQCSLDYRVYHGGGYQHHYLYPFDLTTQKRID